MTKAPTAVICLSPYSGGMEIDSIKMAKKLAPYSKTILIAKKDHFIANEVSKENNDFTLETVRFKSNLGPALIFGIRDLIKKHGIKNVIFFGASELKSLYFSFLGLDINLIIRHGTTKSRPKKDWFHRLIYSNVNYHVAICQHLAKNVEYIIPFGKETQLKVIYSSLSNVSEPKPHPTGDTIQLLHIGRIARGKGQEDAILACQRLVDEKIDFTLTLVGGFDESYRKEFLQFLEDCTYKDKVKLIGHTPDVQSYIDNADIFIFPSHGEGLSNAFLEALSNKLVCISYDNTSFPELQKLGFHFHCVKDRDIHSLQDKLLIVSNLINLEKNKSHNNYILATTLFSLDKELNEYFALLT
jgi:glycosyltransferase involved in cell wall biosynthesis